MPVAEKELMYKIIKSRIQGKTVFFTSYGRLTVDNFQALRKNIREQSGVCFSAKKTLVKRLLNEINVTVPNDILEGPVLLATVDEEPQKLSKTLVDFEKGNNEFNIRGILIEGEVRGKDFVTGLSKLPSREQLLATLLATMKAPITNFVRDLSGIMKNFVVVLNEVKKQKEEK